MVKVGVRETIMVNTTKTQTRQLRQLKIAAAQNNRRHFLRPQEVFHSIFFMLFVVSAVWFTMMVHAEA